MKNKISLLTLLLVLVCSLSAYAQEVHGVTTKRVIYDGPEYSYNDFSSTKYSTEYYGWEIENHNNIKVSVDIDLYSQGGDNGTIVKSQTVILKPKEKYIFKREEHCSTHTFKYYDCARDFPISQYYVKIKAYKLN
ncbi:MAG: hypothetical protein IJ213_07440 [Bacteroidales bacterium]|nr:hypothetical protein [Bacteroidales bacterium]MBQ9312860.1 hypothetical protein [Bacteroidales bacterium]